MSEQTARQSGHGTMSIGDVLTMLKREFPDLTISKIRFLETEGLVTPERTPSGYRRYRHGDVQQLRAVLTMQRDHYLPLKVIREQLEGTGEAEAVPSAPTAGAGLSPHDFRPGAGRVRLSRGELAEQAGMRELIVIELEKQGLIAANASGHYDEDALAVTQLVARLAVFGVEPRHLRSFRVVADRESGMVAQIATPFASPRDRDGKARAQEVVREVAAIFVQLHAALLRAELVRGGKA